MLLIWTPFENHLSGMALLSSGVRERRVAEKHVWGLYRKCPVI